MSRNPRRGRAGTTGDAGSAAAADDAAAAAVQTDEHSPSVVWEARSGQCRIVRWAEPSSNAWYISPEISDGTDLMGHKRWKRVTLYYNQLPSDLVAMLNDLTVAAREMTRGLVEATSPADVYDDSVVQ